MSIPVENIVLFCMSIPIGRIEKHGTILYEYPHREHGTILYEHPHGEHDTILYEHPHRSHWGT